jgi:diguanylate cyclase (GGDEF)-like protein
MLVALCAAAAGGVGVDGVGIMLADDQALRCAHGQPEWVTDVERLQERYGRGPCWDSLREGRPVLTQDVRTEGRWPELAHRSRQPADQGVEFRAVASLPLLAQGRSWGVLDLYRTAARPWSDIDLVAAQRFTHVAASYLVLAAQCDAWQRACESAQHTATHDEITGLPGRGLLFDRLDYAIASGTRGGGAVAVLFIGIDGTSAPDVLGHRTGEATLVEVAHRLRRTARTNDTLARLSENEFVMVCEDMAATTGHVEDWLHRVGERILLELRRPVRPGGTTLDVSVSIGAAVTLRDTSAHTLTAHAEQAMHAARNSGGGRLVVSRTHRH